ncbi:4Fe-4S binding protein [Parabacteroides sp. OttesenSCG-928-N08]|nr:4Fe-4S binding protein [Parabacteroides sp. OttesenSCG-928-N08]
MNTEKFYHALEIDRQKCIGCTHCMNKCPTRAMRIRDGKAELNRDWCVDCAECMKACPTGAIYVIQDDFQKIFDYPCRVALVPSVFTGQFSKYTTEREINSALFELGFTHVFPVEFTTDMVCREMIRQMENLDEKPAISSFCPAIVRLIQLKFPMLVDNILLVKSPVNATATYFNKILTDDGIAEQDIGIFYVSPCAAKIASLKGEEGYSSMIKGVINMDTLYNKVSQILSNRPKNYKVDTELPLGLTKKEMRWSQTGGEAKHFKGRSLAIDEIHNVIEFLERMETTNEVRNVDFLELRGCDCSCAGGVLTVANRFLTAERMHKRSQDRGKIPVIYAMENLEALTYLKQRIGIPPIQPKPRLLYNGTREEVLNKMEQVRRLMCYLPGIDCGACGSPNCKSLAEDIVRKEAQFSDCIFMQRNMEKHGKLGQEHAFRLIEKTWGKDRLNKDCYKKGAKYEGL